MKAKKYLIVLMLTAMVMVLSQSAFATDITPTAIGFDDTEETAMPLTPSGTESFEFFLTNANDVDWYKWTNTTSKVRVMYAIVEGSSPQNFYPEYKIKLPDGDETKLFYPSLTYDDKDWYLDQIVVPVGATVYLRVKANGFDPTKRFYKLKFHYHSGLNTWPID
ncbi:hypothetical protein EBB07_03550 [Paenibacillaceae bacterium]|nr:hypothetical protein EBB07_03550 [Paenibacillaceae bacterium]